MTRFRPLLVLTAAVALLGLPRAAVGAVPSCESDTSDQRFTLKFELPKTEKAGSTDVQWVLTPPKRAKISDKDQVEVCVEHFNFLRFVLKFDVKEQQSEAYSYLTKLWTSIVAPTLPVPSADVAAKKEPTTVLELLHALYNETRALDIAIETAAAPYTKTGLTTTEADELETASGTVSASLKIARTAFNKLDRKILDDPAAFELVHGEAKELYKTTVDLFRAVEGRGDVFLRLAKKSVGVEIKRIGKKNAGTKVTFTLAAIDESGAATPMGDVDYFVQSNMPLVAHGGISFSGLKDVTFEKVRRTTGFGEEDLFQQQSAEDSTTGFALFLGWQFYGQGDVATNHREGKIGAALSLGTDINAPGERVFIGPSLMLFNRFVITGGAVLGKEAEGEEATLEPNIFRIVKEEPKAKVFFSISTKIF